METRIQSISLRETLHFLGWRGTPIEPELLEQINTLILRVKDSLRPRVMVRRFAIEADGSLRGTAFRPEGQDVQAMLSSSHEAVLLAATLGADSEQMLLKEQVRNRAQALLLDAVLSAAIEAVCDQEEHALRAELAKHNLYLTDRFSPGYGDMPIAQTKEICEVLSSSRTIGLTVSKSGIMIPRKSVTAIMGVSRIPQPRRASGCAVCNMRDRCALANQRDTYPSEFR